MTEKNYDLLKNAVVRQAAIDYQKSLCKYKYAKRKKDKIDLLGMIKDCETFFTGDHIMLFTKLDGVELMRRLKQEVIDFNYDYKAIVKSRRLEDDEED